MFKNFTFKRLVHYLFLMLQRFPLIPGEKRWRLLKWGGVKFTKAKPKCFIYKIIVDTVAPELLTIGDGVTITTGTTILTHYYDPSKPGRSFRRGNVVIEDNVFIGVNTIICNSVTIGEGAVVGAGSVVTKDIPPYQVWAGVPARYIKDRKH